MDNVMDTLSVGRRNGTWLDNCESSFGSAAGACSGGFNFAVMFERYMFVFVPPVLLLVAAPVRLIDLSREGVKVRRTALAVLKLASCVVLGTLQVALLVLLTTRSHDLSHVPRASVVVAGLEIGDALALGVLSYMEHRRTVAPSSIIPIYLSFSIIFGALQCRTFWLLDKGGLIAPVFSAVLASKAVLFFLETRTKRSVLMPKWQQFGPEATSGIINRAFFWWLNPLMVQGFKGNQPISSLYALDGDLLSEPLLNRLRVQWRLQKNKGKGKHPLLWALVYSIRSALLSCVGPRLCLLALKLSQPFLITRIIQYMDVERSPETINTGYGLIAATGLVYSGVALLTTFYEHKQHRFMTMIRGALISLVLHETADLGTSGAGSSTLTLINSDVSRISDAFSAIHEIWASVIEVAVAVWLLQRQLGLGSLGPLMVIVASYFLMSFLSKSMPTAQKEWSGAIEKRVSVTSSVTTSMKEVKMLGVVGVWLEKIQGLMVQEIVYSKRFRTLIVLMNVFANLPSFLGPMLAFGIVILSADLGLSNQLSLSTVFTSMAIMGLISSPLAQLLYAVPMFARSLACFERLQDFLDSVQSERTVRGETSGEGSSASYRDDIDVPAGGEDTDNAVTITENASFRFKAEDEPVLRDINIRIPTGSFTAVVGKVGTGKTTLLSGLLGELHTTGRVYRFPGSIAYCAQTPWLVNLTIRQNILGQSSMDQEWYDRVIRACALDRDFSELPTGDLSLIGTKGISLSGGQRHRVALARAVYSRAKVLVIDDVLSGLDWSTQAHIWANVFGPQGLLRRHQLTVILATHHVTNIKDADTIILLGEDGKIAHQGDFATVSQVEQLASLLPAASEHSETSSTVAEADDITPSEEKAAAAHKEDDEEQEAADLLRQSGDWSLYAYYFKHIGWKYGISSAMAAVVFAALIIMSEMWLKTWGEATESGEDINAWFYFGIYVVISLLTLGSMALHIFFALVKTLVRSTLGIHLTLVQTAMSAPLSFFVSTDAGDLINRFSKDMSFIDNDLPTSMLTTWSGLLFTITGAVLVIPGSTYLTIAIPFTVLFLYGLQKFYLRTSRQLRYQDLQASAPLNTHLLESIDGLATIRAFGWRTAYQESSLVLLNESQKPHYLLFCIQRWLALVLNLYVAVLAVVLVALGVLVPSASTKGNMALAITNALTLGAALAEFVASWTRLETSLGALARIKDFDEQTPREIPPVQAVEPPQDWPSKGELEFRDVTASYSSDPAAETVVDHVSLTIRQGEKVAICGRTGSGKSSLLLTMFRLLDLSGGSITLDGLDISNIAQNEVRQRLISVPQDPALFPGTIRSNLCLISNSNHAAPTDAELQSALQKVELWDVVSSLSSGLDTDMSEATLSQGQKQLLCLCRAVLRRSTSNVVVLDEAMSAVDGHTEQVMVRVLETELSGHTVVSVAHRLNTVRQFDRVVVMERGRVVEVGEPGELLGRADGRFRALWDREA